MVSPGEENGRRRRLMIGLILTAVLLAGLIVFELVLAHGQS